MKILLTVIFTLISADAISQKVKDIEFDKLELLIGKKVDTNYFSRIQDQEKAGYVQLADNYNVSYRAKADTFVYNNYMVLGPWLCVSGDSITALVFRLKCDVYIAKLLAGRLGEPSYSKGAYFFSNKSDIKLLYVWPRSQANLFLSLNECSGEYAPFNCIESALIAIQHKDGRLVFGP